MFSKVSPRHEGLVAVGQFLKLWVGKARAAQDEAIYALCFEGMDGLGLAIDVFVCVTEKDVMVGLMCSILDATGDTGKEGVGHIRNDEADVLRVPCG